jgi:hypothetical protein
MCKKGEKQQTRIGQQMRRSGRTGGHRYLIRKHVEAVNPGELPEALFVSLGEQDSWTTKPFHQALSGSVIQEA